MDAAFGALASLDIMLLLLEKIGVRTKYVKSTPTTKLSALLSYKRIQ